MVHDWSKLFDGAFHDFHTGWIGSIRSALNNGLLPPGYYAAAEQVVGGPVPDVVTLDAWQPVDDPESLPDNFAGGTVLADAPPAVNYRIEIEREIYAHKANTIAIRHLSNDRLIAVIEIISPGNKSGRRAFEKLEDKIGELREQGIHLLLIDLIRCGAICERGLPVALGFTAHDAIPEITTEKPFTLTAVRSADLPMAFIELVGVGDKLIDMPVFLNPNHYISLPLEETYEAAWLGVPQPWKQKLTEQGHGP